MKEYEVVFKVVRNYDGDDCTRKDILIMAENDFYDDARHGNLNPDIKINLLRR